MVVLLKRGVYSELVFNNGGLNRISSSKIENDNRHHMMHLITGQPRMLRKNRPRFSFKFYSFQQRYFI